MSNVIYNNQDEQIGYYEDLKKLIVECLVRSVENDDYETASSELDLFSELVELKDYGELIVLSENNGMGYTARPYKVKE